FCSAPALAQTTTPVQPTPPIPGTTTTVETTTIAGTLSQIVTPAGSSHVGDALSLAAQIGLGATRYGPASGGFLVILSPSTGLDGGRSSLEIWHGEAEPWPQLPAGHLRSPRRSDVRQGAATAVRHRYHACGLAYRDRRRVVEVDDHRDVRADGRGRQLRRRRQ